MDETRGGLEIAGVWNGRWHRLTSDDWFTRCAARMETLRQHYGAGFERARVQFTVGRDGNPVESIRWISPEELRRDQEQRRSQAKQAVSLPALSVSGTFPRSAHGGGECWCHGSRPRRKPTGGGRAGLTVTRARELMLLKTYAPNRTSTRLAVLEARWQRWARDAQRREGRAGEWR